MNIPVNAINLAKSFEGLYLKMYICPAGYPTIGYGHLCSKDQSPITEVKAEEYLIKDLQTAYLGTVKYCPVLLTEKEDKLGAIVDFCFNLGVGRLQVSTLRKRINQKDWQGTIYELRKWVYGGGKKLKGLVLRREAEALFFV